MQMSSERLGPCESPVDAQIERMHYIVLHSHTNAQNRINNSMNLIFTMIFK